MSDGIRGILEDMGKLSAPDVPDTCRSWRCEPGGCICHLTAPECTTAARSRLGGHPGASESVPVPETVPNDGAWVGRVNAVDNPPVAGTGPCPGCGGEYPPYYRHACEPVPDDGGGDDPDWPIPDDDPDEWVPDGTGTRQAPEDQAVGNLSGRVEARMLGDGQLQRRGGYRRMSEGRVYSESIPVPDATGTLEAPEGCICGDRYKGRLFPPPPCPIHSGLVADTGYVDALERLMP